jgi:hypothetical protein
MKNLLSSFKSRAETPALPAPEKPQLLPEYDPARLFPQSFRTRARRIDGDDSREFWQQAAEISPLSGWLVSQVEKAPNLGRIKALPDDAPVLSVRHLGAGAPVTLREAILRLAEFEHGGLADESFTGPTKEELGDFHYEAAALKEGIAFDGNGQPHPLVNGMIVTDGYFTEEAYEAALKAQKPEANPARQISLAAIAGLMGTDDIISALEHRTYLIKFSEQLRHIHRDLKELAKTRPVNRFHRAAKFFEGDGRWSDTYVGEIGTPLAQLDTELEKFKGTPLHRTLSLFVYQYQLFALTFILGDAYRHLENIGADREAAHIDLIEDGLKYYIEETCKLIAQRGGDADRLRQFRNLILLQAPAESLKQVENILSGIEKDVGSLADMDIERLRRLANGDCYGLFDGLGARIEAPQKEPAQKKVGNQPRP